VGLPNNDLRTRATRSQSWVSVSASEWTEKKPPLPSNRYSQRTPKKRPPHCWTAAQHQAYHIPVVNVHYSVRVKL
jgi:hypothetical protein